MKKEEILDIFYRQMAEDYSCAPEDISNYENGFFIKELREKRRRFKDDDYLVKVICLNGKCVFCGEEEVIEECRKLYSDYNAAWFASPLNIQKLDRILAKRGHCIADAHHFYLPLGKPAISDDEINEIAKKYEIRKYEGGEIEVFRGDERFKYALSFNDTAKDEICFTASESGRILGMSGVSSDSENMWQIGIDVIPDARGGNLGAFLTVMLKDEVLRREKLPFYGTAESNIQSQKVAVKSGFMPYWWECYSKSMA